MYQKACKKCGVKKSMLYDFVKSGGLKFTRRSMLLSSENQKAIAELVDTVVKWGFPLLGLLEIILTVKELLDSRAMVF